MALVAPDGWYDVMDMQYTDPWATRGRLIHGAGYYYNPTTNEYKTLGDILGTGSTYSSGNYDDWVAAGRPTHNATGYQVDNTGTSIGNAWDQTAYTSPLYNAGGVNSQAIVQGAMNNMAGWTPAETKSAVQQSFNNLAAPPAGSGGVPINASGQPYKSVNDWVPSTPTTPGSPTPVNNAGTPADRWARGTEPQPQGFRGYDNNPNFGGMVRFGMTT